MTNQDDTQSPRPLTARERGYVDRLLSTEFAGRAQVSLQAESALVRRIDDEGSLEFVVTAAVSAPVEQRVPVEAEAADVDGVPIYFLLHVVESKLHELEIYKADGSPITQMPTPAQLKVVSSSA